MTIKSVRFDERLLVSRLPSAEFLDAHRARIAPRNTFVPFSDEIWDGSIQGFRPVELTPAEFALEAAKLQQQQPLINKFARLVARLIMGEDIGTSIDMVGSYVRRINGEEYRDAEEGSGQRLSVSLTKAVPIGVDETGALIWGEVSVEELQRRRGSQRRFQPSAPPLEDLPPLAPATPPPPPPAEAPSSDATTTEDVLPQPLVLPAAAAASTSPVVVLDKRQSTRANRSSLELTPNRASKTSSLSSTSLKLEKFRCGEHRIEFVAWEALQAGPGQTRGRAANLDLEDASAVFTPPPPSRARSLVQRFMGKVLKS